MLERFSSDRMRREQAERERRDSARNRIALILIVAAVSVLSGLAAAMLVAGAAP